MTSGVFRLLRRLRRFLKDSVSNSNQLDEGRRATDYEKIGLVWRPYVMRLSKPSQKTSSVETDSIGFRVARHQGRVYTFSEYRENVASSVLLGNSTAFGVAASCDEKSVSNRLAVITERPWFNLSNRASNVTQEVLSLLLLGARDHHDIVLLSGINDLLFTLGFEQATPFFPAFWGEDIFSCLNDDIKKDLPDRAINLTVGQRYLLMIEGFDRALLLLARYGLSRKTCVLFALQPLLTWIEKPLHPEEAAVCAEWNAVESGFRATHRAEVIGPWRQRFTNDIRQLCQKYNIHFVDLNAQVEFNSEAHLFADRIHLTDLGQQLVAELIAGHLEALRGTGGSSSIS